MIKIFKYLMKEDILWFEIPVNDIIVMHELKSVTDLPNDWLDLCFIQYLLPFQMCIQVSGEAEFEHEVDMGLI